MSPQTFDISLLRAAIILGAAQGEALRARIQERLVAMRRQREAYLAAADSLSANDPRRDRCLGLAYWAEFMSLRLGAWMDGDIETARGYRTQARRYLAAARKVRA